MNEDLLRAVSLLASRSKPELDTGSCCFKEQIAFLEDQHRFKAACCSRRAGKTIVCAYHLIETALKNPGTACLYLTLTRLQAKRIVWEPLKEIAERFSLEVIFNETELTLKFSNRSVIYLSGANDKEEVKKYLGFPLKLVYIDESQSFRPYLRELVDDVLAPTLFDYAGTLCLIGTPGPVPVGYFHDITKSEKWGNHSWTMLQNPYLKEKSGREPMDLIQEECDRRGITIDDPSIQRQCFGKWVNDSDARVFKWDEANHFDVVPVADKWQYVFGVDLGYDDADAVAIIGWHPGSSAAYLIAENVMRKQGISELAETVRKLVKLYDPNSIVVDTGGLGKKIAEELTTRFQLPVKAAEKSDKFTHIELVNDALRTKRLWAKRSSQFAQDSFLLEWDQDKSNGDRKVVSEAFHSDICDALLYAYREASHWLYEDAPKPRPKYGTKEWAEEEARCMEAAAERQVELEEAKRADPYYVDFGEADGWS